MSEQFNAVLALWKPRITENEQLLNKAATKFNKYHYWIGLPATIITVVAGTSLVTDVSEPALRMTIGILGLVAAVLTAVQTFLSYAKRAEEARLAAAHLAEIRRDIEFLEHYPPNGEEAEKEQLKQIADKMKKIEDTLPISTGKPRPPLLQ